eukprot:2989433-Karenia_brevis.AAC.1
MAQAMRSSMVETRGSLPAIPAMETDQEFEWRVSANLSASSARPSTTNFDAPELLTPEDLE